MDVTCDPIIKAAYERRIAELEVQVGQQQARIEIAQRIMTHIRLWNYDENPSSDENDGWSAAEAEWLDEWLEDKDVDIKVNTLHIPCRCDPPGSGKHCNGCCRVRAALAQRLDQRVVWGNAGVLAIFDEVVAEVIAMAKGEHEAQ